MAWKKLLRPQSLVVKPASKRVGRKELDAHLKSLGADGSVARQLDGDSDAALRSLTSLSSLTAPMAVNYMDRVARPVPTLTPEIGVQIVGRVYAAHLLVEEDPARYGAADVPVLGTLPPLKKGRPPQDLLTRVVKASRRNFALICAISPSAWEGFVWCLTKRAHDSAASADALIPTDVVDGIARFAWVLRQVDIHYGLQPER